MKELQEWTITDIFISYTGQTTNKPIKQNFRKNAPQQRTRSNAAIGIHLRKISTSKAPTHLNIIEHFSSYARSGIKSIPAFKPLVSKVDASLFIFGNDHFMKRDKDAEFENGYDKCCKMEKDAYNAFVV